MTFVWILLALALGVALQRLRINAQRLAHLLNQYVLWISLPALTLSMGVNMPLSWQILLPASVAWGGFGGAWLWVQWGRRRFQWDEATTACLLLTSGLGNTSFVGFPLIRSLYGEEHLWIALLIDQPGSFLVLSTLGLMAATYYAQRNTERFQASDMLKRILRFPPFISFALALGLNAVGWQWPALPGAALKALGATLTPAALIAVGLQLHLQATHKYRQAIVFGLAYRLGIAPLLALVVYGGFFALQGPLLGVSVLEAGMAPMITASIVAAGLGLNPPLASAMVSMGIGVSLVTVPLWFLLLQSLGL